MPVLTTGDLTIPKEILDPWLGKVKYGSAVAALSASIPLQFGKGEAFIFDIGEAEYVGEAANKGGSTVTKKSQTTDPFKFHKTVRWTNEVMWADEDHQLGVVKQILDLIQPALSRALDFGIFHGINPTGGTAVAAMTQKLTATTNSVEYVAGNKPYVSLDAADALVLADGYVPRDIALAPSYAAKFSAPTPSRSSTRTSSSAPRSPSWTGTARRCPAPSTRPESPPPPPMCWASSATSTPSAGASSAASASKSSSSATPTAAATSSATTRSRSALRSCTAGVSRI